MFVLVRSQCCGVAELHKWRWDRRQATEVSLVSHSCSSSLLWQESLVWQLVSDSGHDKYNLSEVASGNFETFEKQELARSVNDCGLVTATAAAPVCSGNTVSYRWHDFMTFRMWQLVSDNCHVYSLFWYTDVPVGRSTSWAEVACSCFHLIKNCHLHKIENFWETGVGFGNKWLKLVLVVCACER